MSNISLDGWEKHNVEQLDSQLCVRRAFRLHAEASDFQTDSKFVAGFSVEAPNTGEVNHYLFLRSNSDSNCTCYVTTEEYRVLYSVDVGNVPAQCVVTYGVSNQQLLINSPHFLQPLYGIVGGGLKTAVKVDSEQTDTTAIPIPLGIVAKFGDRLPIAQGSIVYNNDPGVEIRTYVAENTIPDNPGTIYDLFEAPDGLWIVTSGGINVLATDALGQGQAVNGFIRKIPGYSAVYYRNVAQSNGQIVGLFRDGIVDLKTFEKTKLTSYTQKRYLSEPVGNTLTGDLRYGQIWATSEGFLIVADQRLCSLNVQTGVVSWIYTDEGTDLTLAGILKSREGQDLILTGNEILQQIGNREWDSADGLEDGYVQGYVMGQIPVPPEASPVVRFVTTESTNVGLHQRVALRGQVRTAITPAPTNAANVVGRDVWDSTEHYTSAETVAKRHAFAVRTQDISLEIGVEGSFSKIAVIDVELKGQGRGRVR